MVVKASGTFVEECGRWEYNRENTVVFTFWQDFNANHNPSVPDKQLLSRACSYAVSLGCFGYDFQPCAQVYNVSEQSVQTVRAKPASTGGIYKNQEAILEKLGFSKAEYVAMPVLTYDAFSEELKSEIERLAEKIFGGEGVRPVIFVNPLKGMSGDWLYEDELRKSTAEGWRRCLEKMARELDVVIIVNEGPLSWRAVSGDKDGSPHQQIMELYDYLENVSGRKSRIVKLGESVGAVQLAALIFIAKVSGGMLFDIQTGSSHLAQWMDVPEIMIPVEKHAHAIQNRPGLVRIPRFYDPGNGICTFEQRLLFEREVLRAVNKLLRRHDPLPFKHLQMVHCIQTAV